jgi:hypothetical protein
LKVKLPPGYHLEAIADGYTLYASFPFGAGRMTRLVCGFTTGSTIQEIEAAAKAHHSKGG